MHISISKLVLYTQRNPFVYKANFNTHTYVYLLVPLLYIFE
jgi:hypothetical protein